MQIRLHYAWALLTATRHQHAAVIQRETSCLAKRLGDSTSKAYALADEIYVTTIVAPKSLAEFEALKREAMDAVSNTADAHIQNWTRWVIGWEEMHRGRMIEARRWARKLMEVGQLSKDPRSTGLGLWLLTWIALVSNSYVEALGYSEQSLAVAVDPMDRTTAIGGKGCALVLLRRIEEALPLLEELRRQCLADGYLLLVRAIEPFVGVSKVFQGNIAAGIEHIEQAIFQCEKEGYRSMADWHRLFLAEVLLQILLRSEKVPFSTLVRNLPILIKTMVAGAGSIRSLTTRVLSNPHFDPAGHHVGRVQMILGLLYKAQKKRALAKQHLNEARNILSQFGKTPILARVETALAELGQWPP